MEPEKIADVLDDAADYIEANGWCQKHLESPTGEVCASGAIRAVEPGAAWGDGYDALALFLGLDNWLVSSIPRWNDAPGRTEQEVLDAFRAAAKQQRGL